MRSTVIPPLFTLLSLLAVLAFAGFLVVLFAATVFARERAERFLGGFASSARAHYTELALRFLAGSGLIGYAPYMNHAALFRIFGWILLVTTACMLVLPWRWHRRFAGWAVPFALRNLLLYTGSGLLLGIFIIYAVVTGDRPAPG